jgi:hypothetical protein
VCQTATAVRQYVGIAVWWARASYLAQRGARGDAGCDAAGAGSPAAESTMRAADSTGSKVHAVLSRLWLLFDVWLADC